MDNRNSKLLQACDFQHQTSCRYVLCPKVYGRESCSALASDHLPRVTSNCKVQRLPGHLPHSSNTLVLASRRVHLANLKFSSHDFVWQFVITCLSWNLLFGGSNSIGFNGKQFATKRSLQTLQSKFSQSLQLGRVLTFQLVVFFYVFFPKMIFLHGRGFRNETYEPKMQKCIRCMQSQRNLPI